MPRAKRRCPKADCGLHQPCPVHPQGWGSGNSRPLPSNWKALKKAMGRKKEDGCAWRSGQCDGPLELDHIVNRAAGGTDDLSNLQWLCRWHHRAKTAQERKNR